MKYSNILYSIMARLPLSVQFLFEVLTYWRRLCRYNADVHTDRDWQKMQYTLLRQNHIIEKGMSLRNPRRGFGQAKVTALIARLSLYHHLYGDTPSGFLAYPLATIKAYIDYQQRDGVAIPAIEEAYHTLCDEAGVLPSSLSIPAGIKMMRAATLQSLATGNYESLLFSRHSIRYFQETPPSREQLEHALTLAARTPSACNRQAWHTHIYFGNEAHTLLHMQSGCNGFADDIPCCIVVTADMKGFLGHEPFQCYIDGGLYAQNLINALHYVGLGNIPLSCGFKNHHLRQMQLRFNIPDNEVMIVIIGTGVMTDEMKVAISTRKPNTATNIYHTSNG